MSVCFKCLQVASRRIIAQVCLVGFVYYFHVESCQPNVFFLSVEQLVCISEETSKPHTLSIVLITTKKLSKILDARDVKILNEREKGREIFCLLGADWSLHVVLHDLQQCCKQQRHILVLNLPHSARRPRVRHLSMLFTR